MTDTPKRRGRPPGSKNRLVTKPPKPAPPPQSQTTGLRILAAGEAVPWDQAGYLPSYVGEIKVATIKVVLSTRKAFSEPADERAVDWPADWRLPQPGDSVHLQKDWGGIVSSVDFRLQDETVVVYLR